jgi:hypothetical protein
MNQRPVFAVLVNSRGKLCEMKVLIVSAAPKKDRKFNADVRTDLRDFLFKPLS